MHRGRVGAIVYSLTNQYQRSFIVSVHYVHALVVVCPKEHSNL